MMLGYLLGCGGFSDGVLAAGRAGSVSEIKTLRR
jgi:hypothetical protein